VSGYYTPEDRRPPITPGLAVRVAALGFIALGMFAIVFFRLWFLQVLAGDEYLVQANQNRVRDVAIQAPRGDIVDRNGNRIVDSKLANVVQLDPRSLPESVRTDAAEWGQAAGKLQRAWVKAHPGSKKDPPLPPIPPAPPALAKRFESLGRVVDLAGTTIQQRVIQSLAVLPYGSIKLRVGVPRTMILYLQERKAAFPGVVPDTIYLRHYQHKELAAQLLGNVGEISDKQLTEKRYRGVLGGSIIGQDGIEYTYDRYLRGRDGARRLQVDSAGNFVGELTASRREPVSGSRMKLSLDLGLQEEGQRALAKGIALARANGNAAPAAAFVAMNPRNGEVYGMGSAPSFDPTIFTKPISDKDYRALNSDATGKPLFNRAAGGAYPTGSIFKPITALAALQATNPSQRIDPSFSVNDEGCLQIDKVQKRCNAKSTAYGPVDLVDAMKVSSDVYFYELGQRLNSARTEVIQGMARKLGLGRLTGIDLPSGTKGLMPDWRWRETVKKREVACRKKKKIPLSVNVYVAGARGCGISDMRDWSEGDNISLAVGQGDIQASPLQMAVAYSGIVEDGRVPKPHLGIAVEDPDGRPLQKLETPAARKVKLESGARAAVMNGLHAAASAPGGTSTEVWKDWDQNRFPVFGKTGTAQTGAAPNYVDQSWYACWIKDTTKPNDPGIVIVVTVEKGGFGAEAAAPAARLIASKFFNVKAKLVAGTSQTN